MKWPIHQRSLCWRYPPLIMLYIDLIWKVWSTLTLPPHTGFWLWKVFPNLSYDTRQFVEVPDQQFPKVASSFEEQISRKLISSAEQLSMFNVNTRARSRSGSIGICTISSCKCIQLKYVVSFDKEPQIYFLSSIVLVDRLGDNYCR